ncbi:MAG: integrase arm-type DNA-binding domain-containing protein [Burkholderiales bacterium]|jgi:hypothetical protein|nr:integrase arm-type DNA-binding domain-containing protein [Burkholderiales bacterium]
MSPSDTSVRSAKPQDKPYKLFDGVGLFLLVKPNGGKYWQMACCLNGKRKQLSFGSYPKVSLALALLKQGIDPVQHARQIKKEQEQVDLQKEIDAGNTFERIARHLYESKQGKTTEEYRDRILRFLVRL